MPLHLIKLSVGAESIEDHETWVKSRKGHHIHITRMMPKRSAELERGGSLYWVIKGFISCRQRILKCEPITDSDGISRCAISLHSDVIRVSLRPYRPFQGWRYLEDAPPDLTGAEMPEELRRQLAELGLL